MPAHFWLCVWVVVVVGGYSLCASGLGYLVWVVVWGGTRAFPLGRHTNLGAGVPASITTVGTTYLKYDVEPDPRHKRKAGEESPRHG